MTMRWWAAQAGIAVVLALVGALAQTVLNAQGVLNAGLSLPLTALALLPRWLAFVVAVMWAVRRALRKNATRAARKRAG